MMPNPVDMCTQVIPVVQDIADHNLLFINYAHAMLIEYGVNAYIVIPIYSYFSGSFLLITTMSNCQLHVGILSS